jgi:hypothetical protein
MSIQTMAAVWKGSQHSGSALLMMLAIADFADDKGVAYPAVSTLAEKTRMKQRNANYLLSELQASGELAIKIGEGRKGTNLYRIVLSRLQGVQAGAGLQAGAGVQAGAGLHQSAGGAALECSKPLHPSAAEPSLNHQEPSGKASAKPTRLPPCPIQQVVDLYREMLPELVQVRVVDKNRERAIHSLWEFALTSMRDDGARRATNSPEALVWIRSYFERARSNDFIMGRTPPSERHPNWRADIEYVCGPKGQKQVLERTEVAA